MKSQISTPDFHDLPLPSTATNKIDDQIEQHGSITSVGKVDNVEGVDIQPMDFCDDSRENTLVGKSVKKEKSATFQCGVCKKFLSARAALKAHTMIHNNDRPYACSQCDSRFALKGSLKTHVNQIHSGLTYACPFPNCNKTFWTPYLNFHLKTHDKEKNYECVECGKKFATKQSMQVHARRHEGARSYRCKECDKTFTRMVFLKNHLLEHAGSKPFKCGACGKSFARARLLFKHETKKH